jgi:endoglucanase
MSLKEFLIELAEATGPSGHEGPVGRIVRREMEKYADEVKTTTLGSVIGIRRAENSGTGRGGRSARPAPRVMLEGHMDEISLIVTGVEQGMVRFDKIGGYDTRVLPGQSVSVHGHQTLPGIIGSRPPHVSSPKDRTKPYPLGELFVDVGLGEEELRRSVTVGDVITPDRKVVELRNGHLAGKAFDDRAAVASIVDALRQLRGVRLAWDVCVVANVQEEDGADFAGAFTSAYHLKPDVAVAVDVDHADQPGVGDVNVLPLGKGPGIAFGPNVHPRVHARLVQAATRGEIPHRVTAFGGYTGTNAWAIQVVAAGIPTGLVGIPLRYMHTPVETIALVDLERTARLLAEFAGSLDDSFYGEIQGEIVQVKRTGRVAGAPTKRARRKKR